jgi:SAM-dependent methyltransferase
LFVRSFVFGLLIFGVGVYKTTAYNPKNERFQQAAQFLWERYSQELDSWRDQPLWSYTMSKFNMKPILLEKQFFRIESGRYGGRLGTHVYNNDTNSEGQTYYRKMYECCHKDDVDGHDSSTSGGAAGSDGSSSSKNFKARYAWEVCEPITLEDKALLKKEISDYEKSQRFRDKLKEVRGEMKVAAHHASIDHFLKEKVLRPGWSVLELGCAAGAMLQMVQRQYEGGIGEHGAMVGVELVTGWVRFAQNYFANKGIDVFQGDITDFQLPPPYEGMTFDFIMLNDVAEHIQKHRYGCFFQKLRQVTHEGSLVYFHTPNPQTQLVDAEQFFENVLPHHVLVGGMAASNFELVLFQQDVETDCGHDLSASDPSTNGFPKAILGTRCSYNGYTKYYHALFRRVDSKPLFELN